MSNLLKIQILPQTLPQDSKVLDSSVGLRLFTVKKHPQIVDVGGQCNTLWETRL